jgi:1-acyl-sn-glycerol-3-phosphate acyltransferase
MKIFARISFIWAVLTVLFTVALFIILYFFTRNFKMRKITSKLTQLMLFVRLHIRGNVDQEAQIFVMNHQSDIDIMITEVLTPNHNIAWVAKKELFDIPFYGQSMKMPNDIRLPRQDKSGLRILLNETEDRINSGRSVAIFPEGTRSATDEMLSFKGGTSIVVNKLKLKVQPIVLVGTGRVLNVKDFTFKPGDVHVVILDSFYPDPNDKEWLKNLRTKMQEVYSNELANHFSNR